MLFICIKYASELQQEGNIDVYADYYMKVGAYFWWEKTPRL